LAGLEDFSTGGRKARTLMPVDAANIQAGKTRALISLRRCKDCPDCHAAESRENAGFVLTTAPGRDNV
jgi:hypothetical protein